MRIVQVEIENFRGIRSMPPWNPSPGVNCLIGPGDSTKTTILDAIELCLYPRSYFLADDSDFFNLEFDNPIKIIVTLTDLPTEFIAADRYGLFLRGWDEKTKKVEDEPRENLRYALSIALVIDKSLEGRWSVFNERIKSSGDDPPSIRYKDVGQIATTRLGRYAERHLGWGRTSILARIAESGGKFSVQLADARRAAKEAFQKSGQSAFQVTTKKAEDLAKSFSVAPCTSPRLCAHSAQNSSKTTLNRILKTPDRRARCHRLPASHPQPRKTGTQNRSPQVQMLFNSHNSI